MFNKYKNNERVIITGFGKNNKKYYFERKGIIICRDPFFLDYNVKFEDGTEDWLDENCISKEGDNNENNTH